MSPKSRMAVCIWPMRDFILLRDKLNKGVGDGRSKNKLLSSSQFRNESVPKVISLNWLFGTQSIFSHRETENDFTYCMGKSQNQTNKNLL